MTRARLALVFGTRWVSRHQNADVGARFLEEALKLDPTQDGAFFFLREVYGKKGGDWDRVLTLAEEAMTHAGENGDATFLLAQAGTIAWREMGNLIRAKNVFARLASAHPDHPQLRAFEAQIGEKLGDGAAAAAACAGDAARAGSHVAREDGAAAARSGRGARGRGASLGSTGCPLRPNTSSLRSPQQTKARSRSSARSPTNKKARSASTNTSRRSSSSRPPSRTTTRRSSST